VSTAAADMIAIEITPFTSANRPITLVEL